MRVITRRTSRASHAISTFDDKLPQGLSAKRLCRWVRGPQPSALICCPTRRGLVQGPWRHVVGNLKLAFRTLFKTPFVAIVAILSLALGIGANAAIYSMFNQMLLRPLPVAEPERLANFKSTGPVIGSNSCNQAGGCDEVFSYPMFRDLEKANTAFSGIAGHFLFGVNIAMSGQTPISGRGLYVSGSYFPVLGIRPALGRLFTRSDDQTVGSHYVAVLSYGYWENNLGANPAVLGQQITINGQQMTII